MFLPYVYIVRNRLDSTFYIGMRSANKVVAEKDLGVVYFTSSKKVKNNFKNFDIEILAYFKDQLSAFEFENNLIKEHWGNLLLLNKHYQKSMTNFSMSGTKRPDLTEYNKTVKTKPKEERIYLCVICNTTHNRMEFSHKKKREDFVCGHKCNGIRNGRKSLGKRNIKLSESKKGKPAWNKGKTNSTAAENGRKGAKTQSEKVKGRTRMYKEDGSWTWKYPEK